MPCSTMSKLAPCQLKRPKLAEVVFCQGKADEHLLAIFEHLLTTEGAILGTRCSKEQAELIKSHIKSHELYYDPISHIISTKNPEDKSAGRGLICVVTAGTADIKVAEEAAQVCEFFGNKVERIYDAGVAGLHRLLSHVETIQAANRFSLGHWRPSRQSGDCGADLGGLWR